MSLSLLFRNGALCCLVSALTLLAHGQAGYISGGNEYPLSGALAGDQVHPDVSVNSSGGFVVFEDSLVDGSGMGIRALALDSDFHRVGAPFRVNQKGAGMQEKPRVALLNGGGAVFVWQGGRPGFQRIYARFLSSSNTWMNGDVQVNTFNKNSQISPAVAVLTNGNVVVVWASFNQVSATSLQDVYAQMFSPVGDKIGGEIAVNQMTPFNQRTPDVAALANGGFVVSWISEQQRVGLPQTPPGYAFGVSNAASILRPSVDVYVRIFDGSGTPAFEESFVNTASDICAAPALAASPNGGFGLVWSQRDTFNRSNSWDIVFRSFSSINVAGPSRYVNSELFGDQYAPRIAPSGADYCVVWTSLGQDGSREGVYGRFLAADGTASADEFRLNNTTANSQMHPALGSDGHGRFFGVWTSFAGQSSFDIYSRLYVSSSYTAAADATNSYAAPASDPYLNNTVSTEPPKIDPPPVVPPATGNTNGITLGAYAGIFYETNGVNAASSGGLTLVVASGRAFTARVALSGKTYSASGRFTSSGDAVARVSRGNLSSLTVRLHIEGDQVQGQITDGHWTSDVVANRSGFSKTKPAPQAGSFMLDVPGAAVSATSPGGDSYGPVKVDALGNVQWAGSLADGTKVTQKSALSTQGLWPVYTPLYGGQGCLLGWVQVTDASLSGQLIWIKPAGVVGKYYLSGFTNQITITGVALGSTKSATRAFSSGSNLRNLVLNGGGISAPIIAPIRIEANNRVTNLSSNKLSLSITAATGLFRGSVVDPGTGKTIQFQGGLFDEWDVGLGYFLNPAQSGQAMIAPAP